MIVNLTKKYQGEATLISKKQKNPRTMPKTGFENYPTKINIQKSFGKTELRNIRKLQKK